MAESVRPAGFTAVARAAPAAKLSRRRMVGSSHAGCRSETRHPGPDRRRPRRGVRRLHRLGRRPGPRALPAPGRGGHRAARRQPRHPRHPDRVREVAGGDRRARRRAGPGQGELLHRADQGAGEREVLRPDRGLRRRQRRHAHRRRGGEPGRADHLLHRRGAGQHRAARGPLRRRRARRDGRVPLLLRARPRLGLAGAAARAARRAVPADVGDAGRRLVLRRGPQARARAATPPSSTTPSARSR